MGLFSGVIKLAVDTVKMPISIAKDVVNLGDSDEIEENAEDIGEDLEEMLDGDIF